MASIIELLIRSDFDSEGFEEAESAVQRFNQLARSMRDTPTAGAGRQALPTDEVTRLGEAYREMAEEARAAARAAREVGDDEAAQKADKTAAKYDRLATSMQKLNSLTKGELIKNFTTTGASLSKMSKELKIAADRMDKMRTEALRKKQTELAETLKITAARARQAASDMDQLARGQDGAASSADTMLDKYQQFAGIFDKGTANVKESTKAIKAHKEGLEEQRDALLSAGGEENFAKALGVSESIRDLEALDAQLFGTADAFRHLGRPAEKLGKIINSSFFQLGFAMFLAQNTLRNFAGIINGLKDAALQTGDLTDRIAQFGIQLDAVGVNAAELNTKMREASGGFIAFATAEQQVLRLTQAGLGAVAAQADELITLSRATQVATGGLQKAEEVLPKFVDAVIKGDASILKAIPGLEDVAAKLKIMEINAGGPIPLLERQQFILGEYQNALDNIDPSTLNDSAEGARTLAQQFGELKASMGVAFSTAVGWIGDFFDSLVTIGGPIGELINNIKGVLTPLKDARLFAASFAKGLAAVGAAGAAWFRLLASTVKILGENLGELGDHLSSALGALTRGDLATAADEFKQLKDGISVTKDQLSGLDEVAKRDMAESFFSMAKEIDEALGLIPKSVEDAIHDTADALGGVNLGEALDVSEQRRALEWFLGDQRQFVKSSLEGWEDYHNEVGEINAEEAEELANIRKDALNDIADMEADFAKKEISEAKKLGDKLFAIDDASALKISRMQEDAEDKREDIKKKSAKKLEKIEENLARKIAEINRRFDAQRLRALIDRDARALFEAEQRRAEELRKARETAQQKKDDEKEKREEALKELEDDLAKRIRREEEDAQRRKDAAQKAHDDRMEALRIELEEEIVEREAKRDEDLANEKKAATKARMQAEDELKKRLKDLQEHFDEKNRMAEAQRQLDLINELAQMDQASDAAQELHQQVLSDFQAFSQDMSTEIGELAEAYNELLSLHGEAITVPFGGNLFSSETTPIPSPTSSPPPGGTTENIPSGCTRLVNSLLQGAACAIPASEVWCTTNGKKWQCVNGRWQMVGSGTPNDPTNLTPTTTSTLTSTDSPTTTDSGTVTVRVEGDNTLETIFNEMAYTAFMTVIEE